MRSDLHFHSKFSDGACWPEEMVARAVAAGLQQLSLTDHDTMGGVDRFLTACASAGIRGIAGVEIDCVQAEIGFDKEILGYFPNSSWPQTSALLEKMAQRRAMVARTSIDLAAKLYGAGISWEGFSDYRNCGSIDCSGLTISKPNIFDYLLDCGVPLPGYKQFKREFYSRPELAGLDEGKPGLFEVIATISADGGYPVLAHPGYLFELDPDRLTAERAGFAALLADLKARGLWGIELHAYKNIPQQTDLNCQLREIANSAGLAITYGSDSHGKPGAEDAFGAFYGDFNGFGRVCW